MAKVCLVIIVLSWVGGRDSFVTFSFFFFFKKCTPLRYLGPPNIKTWKSVTPRHEGWAGSRLEQLLQAQTACLSEGAEGVEARDRLKAQYIWTLKQIIVLCHLCKQHWALGLMQPRDMALPTEPLSLDSRCAHTHTHRHTRLHHTQLR